ncbi:ACT domain-containing protein [Garciella nitratireducens]|uniref:UPF0237 protein SAMN02745973_00512 n=1 Tax=Garciella nitratireducens DSM 15102 TaxID=1121911 RepID=A0A1T4KGM9_9FIRM|nr:ACT domain-containing protein [Garciella nitratireducens]RBP41531.1 ACT domain-containing protein [Garciella nitratireducens]SJZ41503.1 ACT domain-containing protein [Garciella nitratireducens DSM 15102]
MKAIVSVIGKDKVGITAKVSSTLSQRNANILDISQTILDGFFTMIMIVDLDKITLSFQELAKDLEKAGQDMGVSVKIQHQDIFDAMHNIDKE